MKVHGSIACLAAAALLTGISGCTTPTTEGPTTPTTPTPGGTVIDAKRELWITSVSVVDDPRARANGPWSFGGLMTAMAPSPATAGQFTKDWLATFRSTAPVNTFAMDDRNKLDKAILRGWMKRDGATDFATWTPNLANAPFRLLGIVYRPDLVRFDSSNNIVSAGEGRLVFEALSGLPEDPKSKSLRFTVIFEYRLIGTSEAEVKAWADQFHALGAIPFGQPYNTALQQITDKFSGRGGDPSRPNGSSLNQLRTNELALGKVWQLREFQLAAGGGLAPTTVRQTPDLTADHTALSNWLNANAVAVKAQTHDVPLSWEEKPLLTGRSDVKKNRPNFKWPMMTIAEEDTRHFFSLNTCNGCHNGETGNQRHLFSFPFRHVGSRKIGKEAKLSGFLTGATVKISGVQRPFNDLAARTQAMEEALKASTAAAAAAPGAGLTVARSRRGRTD